MPLLYPSGGLLINMVLAKPEPQNAQATEITCQFTNSLGADMTDLLFQASVYKSTTSFASRNTRFFHDPCVSGREIASDSTTKRWRCDRRARSDPLSPVLPSFQIAVPKFVTMEMRPASGAVVAAHRGAMVTQVVRVTNSMLGQKGA